MFSMKQFSKIYKNNNLKQIVQDIQIYFISFNENLSKT